MIICTVREWLSSNKFHDWCPQATEVRKAVEGIFGLLYTPSELIHLYEPNTKPEPSQLTWLEGPEGNLCFAYCMGTRGLFMGFGWGRGVSQLIYFAPATSVKD